MTTCEYWFVNKCVGGGEVDATNLICRIKKGEELKLDISELTFEMVSETILISCDRFQGSHFVYQIIPSVTVIIWFVWQSHYVCNNHYYGYESLGQCRGRIFTTMRGEIIYFPFEKELSTSFACKIGYLARGKYFITRLIATLWQHDLLKISFLLWG